MEYNQPADDILSYDNRSLSIRSLLTTFYFQSVFIYSLSMAVKVGLKILFFIFINWGNT